MLRCQRAAGYLVLAVTLFQWQSRTPFQVAALQEPLAPSSPLGRLSLSGQEKPAADLVAKLLLFDELVSLENDVIETKKKRSFSGFGSPLDRLSAGSLDLKAKQRKVVEIPKRRFGIPLDRIGVNRLSNTRGLPALVDALLRTSPTAKGTSASPTTTPSDFAIQKQAS
ncbi:osteocrin isoform X2 [Zootoca vivipara]|uniref:osteocrin isoform X2 n=1 Tax=Zootoca vivipara TaxID=8524 RepID=UPI001591C7DE|nr:osteocrin isoform X2 [Zootoca vivipara]XP_034989971.1 osteocrin isoform X2 [Zootoca vivipara]